MFLFRTCDVGVSVLNVSTVYYTVYLLLAIF